MLDLRRFKEVTVSYGMHSLLVRYMLTNNNLCSTWNEIIPQNWKYLVTTILKTDPQLQWNIGGMTRLWLSNNEVGLAVLKFLKINSLLKAIMLICQDSLYMMIIPWFYAVQQFWMLGTGLKKPERGQSHLHIFMDDTPIGEMTSKNLKKIKISGF